MAERLINDPVHGHYSLPYSCWQFIDTPQFQRLRDLKQLGASYYVFPGASHNRFEHSLGVGHLAHEMVAQLGGRQPDLEISPREMQLVQLAGLCHDIGHGPFSHAFEEWAEARSGVQFHHEDMSQRMVEYAIDDHGLDYDTDETRFVLSLIRGDTTYRPSRSFLYEIVSNSRNSIDVDKFDYLSRDALNLGLKQSYDFSRLVTHSRVIGNEICFHSKEVFNVYEMFHTRYSMFKQVYAHRVTKAIEYMISDAFSAANAELRITEAIKDVRLYTRLSDSLLLRIEHSDSEESGMRKAREIVRDIRCRRLYKFAAEAIVPVEHWARLTQRPVRASEIVCCQSSVHPSLDEDDLIVQSLKMNYAMGDQNPVDRVHFYSDAASTESFSIPRSEVSEFIPERFMERYIRVFVRKPELVAAAQAALAEYARVSGLLVARSHQKPASHSQPKSYASLDTIKRRRVRSLHEELTAISDSPPNSQH